MALISQSERQVFILNILSSDSNRGFSIKEIHKLIEENGDEVTERTVRRDIENLSCSNFITEEKKGNTVYFKAGKYTLDSVTLSPSDFFSLAFLSSISEEYQNTLIGRNALEFTNKFIQKAPALSQELINTYKSAISFSKGFTPTIAPYNHEYEGMLSTAIRDHKKVRIIYQAFNSEPSERIIHPYRFDFQDNNPCIKGFCELREAIREFRLSRIQSISILDDIFTEEIPEDIKNEGTFGHLTGGEYEPVELIFSKEIAPFIKEYEAKPLTRISDNPDGTLNYKFNAPVTDELVRWIQKYCDCVKIVSPLSLKDEVRKRIEAAYKL